MKGVVANLTQDDIISLAAYVSSRSPEQAGAAATPQK